MNIGNKTTQISMLQKGAKPKKVWKSEDCAFFRFLQRIWNRFFDPHTQRGEQKCWGHSNTVHKVYNMFFNLRMQFAISGKTHWNSGESHQFSLLKSLTPTVLHTVGGILHPSVEKGSPVLNSICIYLWHCIRFSI